MTPVANSVTRPRAPTPPAIARGLTEDEDAGAGSAGAAAGGGAAWTGGGTPGWLTTGNGMTTTPPPPAGGVVAGDGQAPSPNAGAAFDGFSATAPADPNAPLINPGVLLRPSAR